MSRKIVVMGAGLMGEGVSRLAKDIGYKFVGFLDDYKEGTWNDYPVLGKFKDLELLKKSNIQSNIQCVIPAFNIPQKERVHLVNTLLKMSFEVPVLIHKTCYQGNNNKFGEGTIIYAYTVLGSNVKIGKSCLIKNFSNIGSNAEIGDGVNIYPHVTVGAKSHIGSFVHFYMHSGCGEKISISENSQIYGNSLVIKDITIPNAYWAGTPAKEVKK